jgi:hypothetical protein
MYRLPYRTRELLVPELVEDLFFFFASFASFAFFYFFYFFYFFAFISRERVKRHPFWRYGISTFFCQKDKAEHVTACTSFAQRRIVCRRAQKIKTQKKLLEKSSSFIDISSLTF